MKTTIDELWEDIENFGFKAILSKKEHYKQREKEQMINAINKSGNIKEIWYLDPPMIITKGEQYYENNFNPKKVFQ